MKAGHGYLVLWSIPLCLHGAALAASPPVKVTLQSSWPAAPPLVEILETIAFHNETAFFPLLDALTDPELTRSVSSITSEATHQLALQIALSQGHLSEEHFDVYFAKMDLGLHATTPKIEAYYQYYNDRHATKHQEVLSDKPDCGSWVDWYGEVICDLETLSHFVNVESTGSADNDVSSSRPNLLPFDHVYPSSKTSLKTPPRTAILYASTDSPNFRELHSQLFSLANSPSQRLEYVLRHIPPAQRDYENLPYLSGYGVALDLKKMDYLALDDRNQRKGGGDSDTGSSVELSSEDSHLLDLLDKYPEKDDFDPAVPLTLRELSEIGLRAAQLIYDSSNPMKTLQTLSQNFPKYAALVARHVDISPELRDEIRFNSRRAQPGLNAVWLNGAPVSEDHMNPFSLMKLLRKETAIMKSLMSLGLSADQAVQLLSHDTIGAAQRGTEAVEGIFDASDRAEGGGVIVWFNDIENDPRYASWSPSLHQLLRAIHPSQFHSIKRNLFNTVLAVDLSQMGTLNFVAGSVPTIIGRGFPFRFGVVPLLDTEESARMGRLFFYLNEVYGKDVTLDFLRRVYNLTPTQATVDWAVVRSEFYVTLNSEEKLRDDLGTNYDDIVNGAVDLPSEKAAAYAKRLELTTASNSEGHAFINGKYTDMGANFLRDMQVEISTQLQYFQEQLYSGTLSDDSQDMSVFFYDLPTSAKRRNALIYPSNKLGDLQIVALPDLFSRTGFEAKAGSYVVPEGADQAASLTVYVVADFDSESGLKLVQQALESLDPESPTRLAFVHNPAQLPDSDSEIPVTSTLISFLHSEGLFNSATPNRLLQALGLNSGVAISQGSQTVISEQATINDLTGGVLLKDVSREVYDKYLTSSHLLAQEIGIEPGEQALVVNGRVVGPFKTGDIDIEDIKALETLELSKRVSPVVVALHDIVKDLDDYERATYSEIVSVASSIISAIQLPDPDESVYQNAPQRTRRRGYTLLDGEYTSFKFGENTTTLLHIGVVVDPLSEAAQRWSSLLQWLMTLPSVYVELHIHPSTKHQDVPLKRFYRYNLKPTLLYDQDGSELSTQTIFEGLPVDPIYTLAMDVPQAWLVRPREALHDLDNIQLNTISNEDASKGLEAIFHLDYLVVEGHARDILTEAPPRGLQLQLTASNSTPIADTQVVANLGYFQFRAKPGVFQLEIRPGRGRDVYNMESAGNDGWDSPAVDAIGNEVTLTSFDGLTIYPRFAKIPGMEQEDVLPTTEPEVAAPSLFDKIGSWFSSSPSKEESTTAVVPAVAQADINIFTVASGLLYERFASIMILSVLRNTKGTVKFWFIENFLSPSFLEFIPHFAEEYGFQYELVTYKWPSWLRAQKEKQRIIWAYKILFLDVLFPMDLKKVIFVDADQIVRADLKELVDLDLHGAPYAYTPMGDDNTEMEGFRFWKTGYWAQFLQGLSYHISALYVVDLVRFRQLAAGDMLRGHYQQLSADPNSLANLDQDLPNNLQREVPIFSLPEDWLWCETWCSKDRLHRAKTIDLCQNPLTKEPKLARARQIPEWELYDSEIAHFAQKLAADGRVRSDMAAADSDALANAAAGAGASASTQEKVQEEEIPRDEL